ncbi:MAG: hypothetical protein N2258_08635 [Brevinematales bacterium]|nr:hypothetical protein [Brevinematales bacterium]
MPGVILLVLILFFYSIVLLEIWDKVKLNSPTFNSKLEEIKSFFDKGSVKFIMAFSGLIIGIWNFFAPDFGYPEGGPTIIGALLPSIAMILSSVVIYPGIIEILNIPQEEKNKYYEFIEKYRGVAGVIALVVAILHAILFKIILF